MTDVNATQSNNDPQQVGFVLTDAERASIEAARAHAQQDTEQEVCTCNADGAAHRHTSSGIKRA